MKLKIILRLVLALSCLTLLLTGCHGMGTQRFTAYAPAQARELENSSRIVLDVVYHPESARPDYNLGENLSMLAPAPTHWKLDSTLEVERVIKGTFPDKTLQLHLLRGLSRKQYETLGISHQQDDNIGNGTRLRIGFDGVHGKKLENLKIMLQP